MFGPRVPGKLAHEEQQGPETQLNEMNDSVPLFHGSIYLYENFPDDANLTYPASLCSFCLFQPV